MSISHIYIYPSSFISYGCSTWPYQILQQNTCINCSLSLLPANKRDRNSLATQLNGPIRSKSQSFIRLILNNRFEPFYHWIGLSQLRNDSLFLLLIKLRITIIRSPPLTKNMSIKMNPILNRIHLRNLRKFELFLKFNHIWVLLIWFIKSFWS